MSLLAIPEVIEYLDSLVDILFEKDYFSFSEDALDYVDELRHEIKTKLHTKLHKPAPKHLDRYGKNMKYAGFPKNKHTTWYVFFTTYWENDEEIYLIRFIANNHTIAQYL